MYFYRIGRTFLYDKNARLLNTSDGQIYQGGAALKSLYLLPSVCAVIFYIISGNQEGFYRVTVCYFIAV